MKFGDNLKQIRKYKKISQEELSEKLGVSRQSISKWETGENYPSMTNIMCLCDIFKCKINELVHEDMEDIDSLGEEVKMSVVKFKKDEQKKMKGVSKAVYITALIGKSLSYVGLCISILLAIALVVIASGTKFDVNTNNATIYGTKYNYTLNEDEFSINKGKDKMVIANKLTKDEVSTIKASFEVPKGILIVLSILMGGSLVATLFVAVKLFTYLYKLFRNIHDEDTPFTMDNVYYIKKIAIYVLLYMILGDVCGGIGEGISGLNFNIEIDIANYIVALIVFAISYVFKYGYEIQLDSKGKMYGDINE